MLSYVPKRVSVLVCFHGQNHRIEIDLKKCEVHPNNNFAYKTTYKTEDGKRYGVSIVSLNNTKGSKANVIITDLKSGSLVAERQGVEVRFYRYIFEKQ